MHCGMHMKSVAPRIMPGCQNSTKAGTGFEQIMLLDGILTTCVRAWNRPFKNGDLKLLHVNCTFLKRSNRKAPFDSSSQCIPTRRTCYSADCSQTLGPTIATR